MVRRFGAALLALALPLLVFSAPAKAAEEEQRPSPAQIALFDSDHLKAIHQPVVLEYAFEHESKQSESFSDKIELEVTQVHGNGKKDVAVSFLTGKRNVPFQPVSGFSGNPLLMYFLEYDVLNMQRMTGGSELYFRNRIREAFFDQAEVHPVEIALQGKDIQATEIDIHPFTDKTIPALKPFLGKSYRFILTDQVPGSFYEIQTEVPSEGNASPEILDTVTYTSERP